MTTEENRYCARLDVPVPHVEDYVADNKIKLLELMVLALLERGEPMTMEAVADRLLAAGVRVPTGDVLLSLKKAWHGLKPLYRDNQGRMCLDVQAPELRWLLRKRGLSNQANRPTPLPPLPPEPEVLPDDVPLTEREIRAGTRKVVLHVFPEDERPAAAALLDIGARTIRSWGFIDDTLPAEWAWENPNILYAVLRRSMDENRPVELVWGSAPGWNEPWARARRVMVRSLDFHMVEVDDGNERWDLPRYDIQAVRIVDE